LDAGKASISLLLLMRSKRENSKQSFRQFAEVALTFEICHCELTQNPLRRDKHPTICSQTLQGETTSFSAEGL
jgi:hypothetical protein